MRKNLAIPKETHATLRRLAKANGITLSAAASAIVDFADQRIKSGDLKFSGVAVEAPAKPKAAK